MNEQPDRDERNERLWDILQEAERNGREPDLAPIKAQFEAACAQLLWISDKTASKPAGLGNVSSVYDQVTGRGRSKADTPAGSSDREQDATPRRAV